jgi:hypothetical protein
MLISKYILVYLKKTARRENKGEKNIEKGERGKESIFKAKFVDKRLV